MPLRKPMIGCLGAAGLAVLAVAGTTAAMERCEANLTPQQLIDAIAERRAAVTDLSVEFSFEAQNPRVNMQTYEHHTMMISGDQFWSWRTNDLLLESGLRTAQRAASFDGQAETTYYQYSGMDVATIHDPTAYELFTTLGTGLFDIMLYFPCHEVKGEPAPYFDLLELLNSPSAAVREELEEVDGSLCHVVDVDWPIVGSSMVTIWIDPAQGFLPIRHVHYQKGTDQPSVVFTIDEAIEVTDDVWFPVRGKRIAPARKDVPELQVAGETRIMTVGQDVQSGDWLVSVNQGLALQDFVLVNHLPPGTVVTDAQTDDQWILSFHDYDTLSGAVASAVPADLLKRLQQDGQSPGRSFFSASFTSPGMYLLGLAVMAACAGGVFHGLRRYAAVHLAQEE